MKYLKRFETIAGYNAAKPNLILPNVSLITENNKVEYNPSGVVPPTPSHDYSQDYFTLEAIDNCTFSFDCPSGGISLSTDGGETWTEEYGETAITVSSGAKVLCKGSMEMGGGGESSSSSSSSSEEEGGGKFLTSNSRYNIEGNIFSLYYGDNFTGQTSLVENAFDSLFSEDTYIVSVENLSLPATTLENGCYSSMFYNCTSLTTAPSLPAITLTEWCYASMFEGCTSLTTVPSLPATTLANSCYMNMFNGCTSLTTAPELPATTLASYCYESMFNGCTSLTAAPELSATTLTDWCYSSMFSGCTNLTAAPELPAITLTEGCYVNMFYNCTSLTAAPELPAITLTEGCYVNMFRNCTSLNYIKALFTSTPTTSYTSNWVRGVASSGTFVKNSAATWTSSCGVNTFPCNWTVETASS